MLAQQDVVTYTVPGSAVPKVAFAGGGLKAVRLSGYAASPVLRSDRKMLAYWGSASDDHKSEDFAPLMAFDMRSRKSVRVVGGNNRSPVWSADGDSLFFTRMGEGDEDWSLYRCSFSPIRQPELILGKAHGTRGLFNPIRSAGDRVLTLHDMEKMYWVAGDGSLKRSEELKAITGDKYLVSSSDVFTSKPGHANTVLFSMQAEVNPELQKEGPGYALYIFDFDTGKRRRLTPKSIVAINPCWSRDGNFAYYEGQTRVKNQLKFGIYRIAVNGSGNKLIAANGREPSVS